LQGMAMDLLSTFFVVGGRKIMFDFSCWNNDKNNRSLKVFS